VLAILSFARMLVPSSSRHERLVASGLVLLACLASVLTPPGRQPFFVSECLLKDTLGFYRVLQRPYTLVHKVISFADKNSFRRRLAAGFDYQRIAALEKSKKQTIPPLLQAIEKTGADAPMSEDLVERIFRIPNVIGVLANSTKPGLLILNERWRNDWHARVNSRSATVLRVKLHTTRAVALLVRRNYVEFEYKPMLFWNLLILQRATFLLLVLVDVWKLSRFRVALGTIAGSNPRGKRLKT
jgi:hypothetical protein